MKHTRSLAEDVTRVSFAAATSPRLATAERHVYGVSPATLVDDGLPELPDYHLTALRESLDHRARHLCELSGALGAIQALRHSAEALVSRSA